MKRLIFLLMVCLLHQGWADTASKQNSTYLYSDLRMRFLGVAPIPSETKSERIVAYLSSVCLKDRKTGNRPAGLPFQVIPSAHQNESPIDLIKVTDANGCLTWASLITDPLAQPSCYYKKSIRIISGPQDAGKTVTFFINPKDEKFTFGFDSRELSDDFPGSTLMPLCPEK